MAETDLVIGSLPISSPIDVNSAGEVTIAGSYYLRHPTPSLSLFDAIAAEMTAAGVAGASLSMRENLRVRISGLGLFDIDFGDSFFPSLLGFGANDIDGTASSYDAPNPSPLIWAPGSPATPTTIRGKAGYVVPHTTFHSSDDETSVETQHFGSGIWQEVDWSLVPTSRLAVPDGDELGNTFEGLHRFVLQFGYRFRLHQSVVEDPNGTDSLGWNDAEAFGPYQLRGPVDPSWYQRRVQNADDYGAGIGLEMKVVEEYA